MILKTRADLYSKEAAELLRVISCYKVLYTEQVINLFSEKEEKIRTLMNNLRQQRRIWLSQDGRIISVTDEPEPDTGILKAFWLLLDFIGKVENHSAGNFPITLFFFLDAEFYEVIYIQPDQEALICHALFENTTDTGKRIIIVEDAGQIEKINVPGVSGFCTVTHSGTIQYYQRK